MFAEEWPLMMFTLISQLAVGSFVILSLVRFALIKQDPLLAAGVTNPGFKAVGAVMVLALLLSVFHLGSPFGAYRAILNLQSSWLSREIVAASGFLFFWFLSYRSYQKEQPSQLLAALTSLIGLAVILCMGSIYSHSVRPAWTDANTYIAFFGATFALGSLGAAAFIAYAARHLAGVAAIGSQLKKVSFIAGAAVFLPLLYLPVYIGGLAGGNVAAQASAQLLTSSYQGLLVLKGILSLAGAGLGFAIWRGGRFTSPQWAYLAFGLVMLGEFVGRYVFYGAAVSTAIGLN